MNPILSYSLTFIAGAISSYIVSRLLEQAKLKDLQKVELKNFAKVKRDMPDLIKEIENDIANNSTDRIFYIAPSKGVVINTSGALRYNESEHSNLLNKISILENYGFVHNITDGNIPKYRFDESFIDLIIKKK